MNLVDCTIRYAIPALGISTRWLKEELEARGVKTPLAEACLKELVMDAQTDATLEARGREATGPYAAFLRTHLAARAEFLRRWTLSDDRIEPESERLVRIARKFALPRPWKLSEPVAYECHRRVPTYFNWLSTGGSSTRPRTS
jgi:hypothetical protein